MQPYSEKLMTHFNAMGWLTENHPYPDREWRKEDHLSVTVPLEDSPKPAEVRVNIDCFGKQVKVCVFINTYIDDVLKNDLVAWPIHELIESNPKLKAGNSAGSISIYTYPTADPEVAEVEEAVRTVAQMYETVKKAVASAQKLIKGYYRREQRRKEVEHA